jgi:tRNA pseudouridine55 synthase
MAKKMKPVLIAGQPFTAGVVLIDKPVGLSSFAIVNKIRKLLGVKKVGHAGTLDPFASGLLIVCAGRSATRNIDGFMAGTKTYLATIQLGVETLTLDTESEVVKTSPVPELGSNDIDSCLNGFSGELMQAPPPFSAVKHKGKPLYYYARQGIMIEKPARAVKIYKLSCLGYDLRSHRLDIIVQCSRGTYIRVLAADIGRKLGSCGYLVALRRTGSGEFSVADSLDGKLLDGDNGLDLLLGKMKFQEHLPSSEDRSW